MKNFNNKFKELITEIKEVLPIEKSITVIKEPNKNVDRTIKVIAEPINIQTSINIQVATKKGILIRD